ncbi:hypothetical protein FB451DRAFT_1360612, partial [Mycena latifolia]
MADVTVPLDIYTDVIKGIQIAWAITAAEVFLYGAYVVMFAFYLNVLRTRRMAQHRFLTGSTISLFILCTAHCALELATAIFTEALAEAMTDLEVATSYANVGVALAFATNVVYVTSNVLADCIFIFRCYAIWNFRRKIIIFPMILTLAVAVLGYSTIAQFYAGGFPVVLLTIFDLSIGVSLFTTFVLMGLTVGRIWWLAREARLIMGQKVAKRYYTVCAMILESGCIFAMGGIAFVATGSYGTFASIETISGGILGQLVGIAPTIIAVRVALGYSVDNVDSFIAPRPRTRPPPRLNSDTPSVHSVEERVLYIGADRVEQDMV